MERMTPMFENIIELYYKYCSSEYNGKEILDIFIRSNIYISVSGEETDQTKAAREHERFVNRLSELFDGLNERSLQRRVQCFYQFGKELLKKLIPDFVEERRTTLLDIISTKLVTTKIDEQLAAAMLASVVCVQLGAGKPSEQVYQQLTPLLLSVINNKSELLATRTMFCMTLGYLRFLARNGMDNDMDVMRQLERIFSTREQRSGVDALRSAALGSWTLYLTFLSPRDLRSVLSTDFETAAPALVGKLYELLFSQEIKLCLKASAALVVVFELGRKLTPDYAQDIVPDLVAAYNNLITTSKKHERILQEEEREELGCAFRKILRFIRDNEVQTLTVKFGREQLVLENWVKKIHYNVLCQILDFGVGKHLTENQSLREIFGLKENLQITRQPVPMSVDHK